MCRKIQVRLQLLDTVNRWRYRWLPPAEGLAESLNDGQMKKLALIVVGLVTVLALFIVYARFFGYDPGPTRPGMWMSGELVTEPVTDWSFAQRERTAAIQTRQSFFPWLAHSVTTAHFHYKDRLYFASGYPAGINLPEGRHWNVNVLADPRVRIRLGTKLYDRTVVYVTDPVEREAVLRHLGPMFWSPGFNLHLWRVEPRT